MSLAGVCHQEGLPLPHPSSERGHGCTGTCTGAAGGHCTCSMAGAAGILQHTTPCDLQVRLFLFLQLIPFVDRGCWVVSLYCITTRKMKAPRIGVCGMRPD
jgi:hypothetical protein